MLQRKKVYVTLLGVIVLVGLLSDTSLAAAHSPKYIDIKYYEDDDIISVYFTHGVSNRTYHYLYDIKFEFFEYNATQIAAMEEFGKYVVQPGYQDAHYNVEVIAAPLEEEATKIAEFHDYPTEQLFDEIWHVNYTVSDYNSTLDIGHYTYIKITGYCNLGGSFSHSILAGQIWWDLEHSMLEAVVPTLVCAVIILAPLVVWGIYNKKKEIKAKKAEESQ